MPPRRRSIRINRKLTQGEQEGQPEQPPPPPVVKITMESTTLEKLIAQRVTNALVNYQTIWNTTSGEHQGGGTNGQGSSYHGGNVGPTRACTYKDFMSYTPKSFYGNEGVIGIARWIEKTESIFQISFCLGDCKARFVACTFMDTTLTWWNDNMSTVGVTATNNMTWEGLKELLIEEYYPRDEIQSWEQELWSLTMKGAYITGYTNRFTDLSLLCPTLASLENKKVERYIQGLAPQIQAMVMDSRPTIYKSVKRITFHLITNEIQLGTMVEKIKTPKYGGHERKFNGRSLKQSSGKNRKQERFM